MKAIKLRPIDIATSALALLGCTDQEIEQTDSIFPDLSGEFNGVEPDASLTNLYNSIRGQIESQENVYALAEVASGEFVVPTRGTDWGGNGVCRTLHSHTWDATHHRIKHTWDDM